MACYRTFLSIEALFTENGEGLKISFILWQTVEGRALILTTNSVALKLMNVTALLSSDKPSSSRFISISNNIHETHAGKQN
jgi:hypothetical protein